MLTAAFWRSTAERTIRTMAQTAASLLAVDGLGILDVDWVQVGSAAGMAGVLAVLTALASGAATTDSRPGITEKPAN